MRSLFLEGRGINASVAVHQDVSGKAEERAFALGVAAGCGYMYPTTFEREVLSDLVGERGILMGAIQGAFAAQYKVLRENGHTPSEAFNETVEEATGCMFVSKNGMDWMYVIFKRKGEIYSILIYEYQNFALAYWHFRTVSHFSRRRPTRVRTIRKLQHNSTERCTGLGTSIREANLPISKLYAAVKDGSETRRTLSPSDE